MNTIVKILGTSSEIFFLFADGEVVVGSGEFMCRKGIIDGFYVYTNSLKFRNSDMRLSSEQAEELIGKAVNYQFDRDFILEFIRN